MAFERLEPYAVKVARVVLRRGRKSDLSSLSDLIQIEREYERTR